MTAAYTPTLVKPLHFPWRISVRFGRWSRWTVGLISIALLGAIWSGLRKVPTGPAAGSAFNQPADGPAPLQLGPPAAVATRSFRIGTFNIHSGIGTDGRLDLDRTARELRGCAFVGLNEVRGGTFANAPGQAAELGRRVQAPWVFLPVESRWWRDDFGNGAVSALPITHWTRLPISPLTASSNRNVNVVKVDIGGGRTLSILLTHLGRHEEHDGELDEVSELFTSMAAPAILIGDLNATDENPLIRRLQQTPGVVDAVGTVPEPRRHGHIDWIFLRGMRCTGAGVEDHGASDHPFYWADVQMDALAGFER
jgi:endonuclease/exonuclease/phosphatase family metal-dependent hydrolase